MKRDAFLIFASAGLRSAAVSLCGVILALYLAAVGFDAAAIGVAVSLGLAGCALGTFLVSFLADRAGRRRTLIVLAVLMAAGGVALAWVTNHGLLLVCAFVGMVNGMGRDRGAGVTVEQAMIPQAIPSQAERTRAFAWYNVAVDGGHALGAVLGGLPAWLRATGAVSLPGSYQGTWIVYGVLCLAAGALALWMSPAIEARERKKAAPLSAATRPVVAKFAALSALDSFGGGFLTTALVSYWFFKRFGVDETGLGLLFFTARILNGLSHLGAAWLARRIGLVNTMVFTHIPSSLMLMTVPLAPSLPVAVALFLARESLVEMDVPTRQSYIVAVVREEERTRAAGITNFTRSVAWATAPALAGSLMSSLAFSAPIVIGPALKIIYDAFLYREFRHLKPPEEQRGGS